jgi:hypothetical protein
MEESSENGLMPSQSMHPLGYGDTDQIDPAVAEALTTYQVEWLFTQCQELSLKKLQILRQALFEWVDEHPHYRFSVSTFGSVMRVALENYINRHQAEFMSARSCVTLLSG